MAGQDDREEKKIGPQLTRTYNTAYSTSQTYHTQSSPEM